VAELILYACPVGPLATAIEAHWRQVESSVGPNSAHEYMPHVTLTGFFRAAPSEIHRHVEVIGQLVMEEPPPPSAVSVTGALYEPDFHVLTVESRWAARLARRFADRCPPTATRAAAIRPKDRLHVSLAYGFTPDDGPTLQRMSRAAVDPSLPTVWELRFYERLAPGAWCVLAAWPL
jgi:ubiquitin-associated SH3 domain-containing protein